MAGRDRRAAARRGVRAVPGLTFRHLQTQRPRGWQAGCRRRESRGRVVTFHTEIPDLQLEHLPTAVEALRALDGVESIAVVPLPGRDEEPAASAEEHEAEVTCGDGESVGHQP